LFCSAVADAILEGKADANAAVVKDEFVEVEKETTEAQKETVEPEVKASE
jgi:hypothetical protein